MGECFSISSPPNLLSQSYTVRKLFSVHHSYHYGDTSYTGVATYADTNIVWEENGSLHFRCQPHREYNLDTLTADVSISLNKRFPLLPDSASPLPLPLPDNTFVKAPTAVVSSVAELKSVAQGFLAELQLLETTLRSQPHPRISKYLGYVSEDGERVTGLVFEKYEENVWDARSRVGDNFDGAKIVAGVRKALQHLHSLGLVHVSRSGNSYQASFHLHLHAVRHLPSQHHARQERQRLPHRLWLVRQGRGTSRRRNSRIHFRTCRTSKSDAGS